uniref:4c protein n=2 Tax=Infectious bronchitis virus TaxID=11120 RepID=A0A0D3MEG6_9GAMC|nr:4c protein [Infectious bronchitis virus]APP92761.1 4c protein [Infectious bronchitis virus]QLI34497.1 4c accessory peptide [Infectious bronchitis virus]
MEKLTTKADQSFRKVVAGCGPVIRNIKLIRPPTTLVSNKGVWTYKRLTNTDDEMAD